LRRNAKPEIVRYDLRKLKTRKQVQRRCAVFRSKDSRSGRTIWYTLVFPVHIPLRVRRGQRAGQLVLGEDVREQHSSEEEARERAREIDSILFPQSQPAHVPLQPTRLTKAQLAACERVLLAEAVNARWGDSPELVLQMWDFCRARGFIPAKVATSQDSATLPGQLPNEQIGASTAALTYKGLAIRVLVAKGELTPREIWEHGLAMGLAQLVRSTGRTPVASLASKLYVDIKRNPNTPFERTGKRFRLRSR
jgi:hypothetical protein